MLPLFFHSRLSLLFPVFLPPFLPLIYLFLFSLYYSSFFSSLILPHLLSSSSLPGLLYISLFPPSTASSSLCFPYLLIFFLFRSSPLFPVAHHPSLPSSTVLPLPPIHTHFQSLPSPPPIFPILTIFLLPSLLLRLPLSAVLLQPSRSFLVSL